MAKAKVKNATFSWECTNAKGQTVKGETIAASADVVKAELRKQGLTPKKGKIKKKGGSLFGSKEKTITTKDAEIAELNTKIKKLTIQMSQSQRESAWSRHLIS